MSLKIVQIDYIRKIGGNLIFDLSKHAKNQPPGLETVAVMPKQTPL